MKGHALVAKIKDAVKIPGADKIVQYNLFGETIITTKDYPEGTLGLLMDLECQLGEEFCHHNNLYRHSTLNKDTTKSGYFEDNRRVRAIRLKGIKVTGFWLPLSSLSFISSSFPTEGTELDSWKNIEICRKYLNPNTLKQSVGNKQGKAREVIVNSFREHSDTDQLCRNLDKIKEGNLVIVTEKIHGTSGRCGNLPIKRKKKFWQFWKKKNYYGFVTGSRRTVKYVEGENINQKSSFYDTDIWTLASERFKGKLRKGETVYFEIVGFLPSGKPIMYGRNNSVLKPFMSKDEYTDFVEEFGQETHFTYNCSPGEFEVYIYRITLSNEDGFSLDYSWEYLKTRCEEMGVKHVPQIDRFILEEFELTQLENISRQYIQMKSKEFPFHIKEGICWRIENRLSNPLILKDKSVNFKILEGIIKDTNVDIEEAN